MHEKAASEGARLVLLATVIASILLISIKTTMCVSFFSFPGARALVVQTILLLVAYCLAIAWPDRSGGAAVRSLFATRLGIIAGLVQVIHLFTERFASLPRPWDGWLTLGFMLATFLIWAAAGFRARKHEHRLKAACLSSAWCSIVTMTIAALIGILMEWWIAPVPLESMRAWAEFQRSGGTDLYAFSIANVLDSASSHLLAGPLIACLFGIAGYQVAPLIASAPRSHTEPRP
jgi:hypothetical protein